MTVEAYRKGDGVRFTGAALHASSPAYYPPRGTVGTYQGGGWVQWPSGTTSGDDRWHAPDASLQPLNTGEEKRAVRGFLIVLCPIEAGERELFTPHLEMHGEHIGDIGMSTKFRDVLGRQLYVGDVVEIFNRRGVSYGDNAVCDDGGPYIMGIKSSCDGVTGATGYWKLLKKRGHEAVENGAQVDGVLYVKEKAGGVS